MIPQHSRARVDHFTPIDIVEMSRRLLNGIELDPASCASANARVKAERYFNSKADGLAQEWRARAVFLNPPGGVLIKRKDGNGWKMRKGKGPGESSMRIWWDKLVACYEDHRVGSAIFIGFTLEILRTSQKCLLPVQRFARCYPSERQCFRGDDPTHGNVIVYLPPREGARGGTGTSGSPRSSARSDTARRGARGGEGRHWHKRFAEEFGSLGYCEAGGERL